MTRIDRPVLLFDDVFFSLADSGIAKYWSNIMHEFENFEKNNSLPVELIILNRSNKFANSIFQKIDFPLWDTVLPAVERSNLAHVAKHAGASIFLSSYDTYCPGISNYKVVYDLIPEVFHFEKKNRTWLERVMSMIYAKGIIAISNSTLHDLNTYYPKLQNIRNSIAYPGVIPSEFYLKPESENFKFRAAKGFQNYVLYIGARGRENEYKNGQLLFEMLNFASPDDFGVIFVGGNELSTKEIESLSGFQFHHLYPTDFELGSIISAADCTIVTSIYEGFGMPVLESLACGTPVITTGRSSLPEASGDLDIRISGASPIELFTAIKHAQSKTSRDAARENGPKHSQAFTWSKTAKGLLSEILDIKTQDDSSNLQIHHKFNYYDQLMLLSQY